jgi:hypothetical protein
LRSAPRVCELHRRAVRADAAVDVCDGGESCRIHLCAEHLAELRIVIDEWLRPGTEGAALDP